MKDRLNITLNGAEQELVLKLVENISEDLRSKLNGKVLSNLIDLLTGRSLEVSNKKRKLFVLVDYIVAFTSGSLGSEYARLIDDKLYERVKNALEDEDTKVVVLIDEHNPVSYKSSLLIEEMELPIHAHTLEEKLLYGRTGRLFNKYWNSNSRMYTSDDKKVYFIYKNKFGCTDISDEINMVIKDAINVADVALTHEYLNGTEVYDVLTNGIDDESNPTNVYDVLTNLYYRYWDPDEIIVVGVATNICVLTNAVILSAQNPTAKVYVYEDSVASYDLNLHYKALDVMEGLLINVVRK